MIEKREKMMLEIKLLSEGGSGRDVNNELKPLTKDERIARIV